MITQKYDKKSFMDKRNDNMKSKLNHNLSKKCFENDTFVIISCKF